MSYLSSDEINAYHEAGHAVVGYLLGREPLRVSITPHVRTGQCEFKSTELDSEDKKRKQIIISLAGHVADEVFSDLSWPADSSPDIRRATQLLEEIKPGSEDGLECYQIKVRELIRKNFDAVAELGFTLLQKRQLEGDELIQILNNSFE